MLSPEREIYALFAEFTQAIAYIGPQAGEQPNFSIRPGNSSSLAVPTTGDFAAVFQLMDLWVRSEDQQYLNRALVRARECVNRARSAEVAMLLTRFLGFKTRWSNVLIGSVVGHYPAICVNMDDLRIRHMQHANLGLDFHGDDFGADLAICHAHMKTLLLQEGQLQVLADANEKAGQDVRDGIRWGRLGAIGAFIAIGVSVAVLFVPANVLPEWLFGKATAEAKTETKPSELTGDPKKNADCIEQAASPPSRTDCSNLTAPAPPNKKPAQPS